MRYARKTFRAIGKNVSDVNLMGRPDQLPDEEMARQVSIRIQQDRTGGSDSPKHGGQEDVFDSGHKKLDDVHATQPQPKNSALRKRFKHTKEYVMILW